MLHFILLAIVAATPALVLVLANQTNLGLKDRSNAVKTAAIFSIVSAALVMAGYWIGQGLRGMIEDDMLWIVDTLWFVIGLKMIFTSFKVSPRYVGIDLSSTGSALLAAIAAGTDSLLIAVALGIIRENVSQFVVYATGIVFLFTLSGLSLLSANPFLVKHNQRLLMLSGSLLIFLTIFVF